jgi:hypothetical protein
MKFNLFILFFSLVFSIQAQMPSWLSADPTNTKLVYVTGLTEHNQTGTELPTTIKIELIAAEKLTYSMNTFDDHGHFEFFLRPDGLYHITFQKPGYLAKKLEVVTGNVPDDQWDLGFVLDLTVSMEESIPNFSSALQDEPFARCMYSGKTERIEFDKSYSKQQRAKWDSERQRCLTSQQ